MIVLKETNLAQTIKFIPRKLNIGQVAAADSTLITADNTILTVDQIGYNIAIRNETTNKDVYNVYSDQIMDSSYYSTYNAVLPLKQDVSYTLKITGIETIYKDKIFCTNQTDVAAYTVNQGEYIFNDTDNEFITL